MNSRAQLSSFDVIASMTAFLIILLVASLVWDSLLVTISEKEVREQMQMMGERSLDFLAASGSQITSERYVLDGNKVASLDARKDNLSYAGSFKSGLGVPTYNLTLEIGLPSPVVFPNASYAGASLRAISSRPFLYNGSYVPVRVVVWK